MNAVLLKALDATEASLAALLESIAADDPSAPAAAALIAADDAFSSGLTQLATHQTNHQRLMHLRALSAALDAELSTLLATLATTRALLLAAPSTVFPDHVRRVEYDSLLAYANKIAKFTRPPTHLKPAAGAAASSTTTSTALVKSNPDAEPETDAPATNGADEKKKPPPSAPAPSQPPQPADAAESANPATGPTAEDIALLDPTAHIPFAPWPSEETMKRGILANLNYLDPTASTNPPPDPAQQQPSAAAAGTTTAAAATAERERQPAMTDADRERAREDAARRDAERKAKEHEVFQGLDLYDSDSD